MCKQKFISDHWWGFIVFVAMLAIFYRGQQFYTAMDKKKHEMKSNPAIVALVSELNRDAPTFLDAHQILIEAYEGEQQESLVIVIELNDRAEFLDMTEEHLSHLMLIKWLSDTDNDRVCHEIITNAPKFKLSLHYKNREGDHLGAIAINKEMCQKKEAILQGDNR